MKKIVFLGDSLTWGSDDNTVFQHSHEKIWINILKNKYKNKLVIEGLGIPGLAANSDPANRGIIYSSKEFLNKLIYAFSPADYFIIWLGTNNIINDDNDDNVVHDILKCLEEANNGLNEVKEWSIGRTKLFPNTKIFYMSTPKGKTLNRVESITKKVSRKYPHVWDITDFEYESRDGIHMNEKANKEFAIFLESKFISKLL